MYKIGKNIEDLVNSYLQEQGLKLVEVNYRCRVGEIDLIMKDRDTFVFVEVRYRKSSDYGDGAVSVNFRKQNKIKRAAAHYLQKNNLYDKVPCRFDIVAVRDQGSDYFISGSRLKAYRDDVGQTPCVWRSQKRIDWIKDAFWDKW